RSCCCAPSVLCPLSACQPPVSNSDHSPAVVVRSAPVLQFRGANSAAPDRPGETDCNSPAHWDGGTLYVFSSAGQPWRSSAPDLLQLDQGYVPCRFNNKVS